MSRYLSRASALLRPPAWLVTVLAMAASLICLALYLGGEARGRMAFLTLPAVHWGTPPSLAAHGLEPLYRSPRESGWDGQFYYWMANDPLGTGDVPPHVDSPSYRYQRIGMSGTAWLLSRLTLRDWVPPGIFYLTSLLAIAAATWSLARFFTTHGASAWLALCWALGLGTQMTLLNGLPDAFADAMVILAVLALARLRPRPLLYAMAMSLAVLSREAYVGAAALIGILHLLRLAQGEDAVFSSAAQRGAAGGWMPWARLRLQQLIAPAHLLRTLGHVACLAAPGLWFGAWQLYIRVHFGRAPAEQAGGILAPPLQEFLRFFRAAWSGVHPVWGANVALAHQESVLLLVFAALLLGFFVAEIVVLCRVRSFREPAVLVLAFVPVVGLYLCFGHIVMMHHSGYLKAANAVLFLVPFAVVALALPRGLTRFALLGLTLVCGAIGTRQFVREKTLSGSLTFGRPSTLHELSHYHAPLPPGAKQEPLRNFASDVRIVGSSSFFTREWPRELRGASEIRVFDVSVTNRGTEPYGLAEGVGAIRLSYHWLTPDGLTVMQDGIRSNFQTPLPVGETRVLSLYVEYPRAAGDYLLRISLVQEGVSWFYLQGTGYTDLRITVR